MADANRAVLAMTGIVCFPDAIICRATVSFSGVSKRGRPASRLNSVL